MTTRSLGAVLLLAQSVFPCVDMPSRPLCAFIVANALGASARAQTYNVFILFTMKLPSSSANAQLAIQAGLEHHQAGRFVEAEKIYDQILRAIPNHPYALHYLGVLALQMEKNDLAAELFGKAVHSNPSNPMHYLCLGIALKNLGKQEEAILHYRQALALKPDYLEAQCNLGNALKEQGATDEAETIYRKALESHPDSAQIHYNLGVLLRDQGKQREAIDRFRKAILCKPDYANAYNNLGSALSEVGDLNEAIAYYKKAQECNPDFAAPYYNLHALLLDPHDMVPAIACLHKAVELEPSNPNYRFFLGMLLDYTGNPAAAANQFEMIHEDAGLSRADLDAWQYIRSVSENLPQIIGSSMLTFQSGLAAAMNEGLVLEFGVCHGTSIRQIAALVNADVHGFDSFEGLPEAWHHDPKGSYSTHGALPSVPNNVTLHAGWFEDTLPKFLEENSGPVRFANIDCDLYSSTKTILELLAQRIVPGTVIVFDEYIGNLKWREDEFKAFQEAVRKNQWSYEYICFSFTTKQVAVRIK